MFFLDLCDLLKDKNFEKIQRTMSFMRYFDEAKRLILSHACVMCCLTSGEKRIILDEGTDGAVIAIFCCLMSKYQWLFGLI